MLINFHLSSKESRAQSDLFFTLFPLLSECIVENMVWPLFGNMEFHRSSILVSKSHKRKNFLAETTYYRSKDNRKSVFSGRGEKRGGVGGEKGGKKERRREKKKREQQTPEV